MQLFVTINLFLVAISYAGSGKGAKPPGFIEEYGKAMGAYTRKIEEAGGDLSMEDRRQLYKQLFSDAKAARERDKKDGELRLKRINNRIKNELKAAMSGMPSKGLAQTTKKTEDADKSDSNSNTNRVPASSNSSSTKAASNTGDYGGTGTAETIHYGSADTAVKKSKEQAKREPESAQDLNSGKANGGAAESVSFGVSKEGINPAN